MKSSVPFTPAGDCVCTTLPGPGQVAATSSTCQGLGFSFVQEQLQSTLNLHSQEKTIQMWQMWYQLSH